MSDPYRTPGKQGPTPPSVLDAPPAPPVVVYGVGGYACVVGGTGGTSGPAGSGAGGPMNLKGGPKIYPPCCGFDAPFGGMDDRMRCGKCGKTFSLAAAEHAAASVRP